MTGRQDNVRAFSHDAGEKARGAFQAAYREITDPWTLPNWTNASAAAP